MASLTKHISQKTSQEILQKTSPSRVSSSAGQAGTPSEGSAGDRWSGRIGRGSGEGGVARCRPPKLYRIGEIVEYYGVSRQTIHNYTTMGLLQEANRTRGGHRLYDEAVFDRLDAIVRMKAENRSLGFIREYFAQAEDGEHDGTNVKPA